MTVFSLSGLPLLKVISRPFFLGASLFVSYFSVSQSYGRTLDPLPESCFRFSSEQDKGTGNNLTTTHFHAELVGTGYSVDVSTSVLKDHKNKLDSDALIRVNAAAAYGVLVAYHHDLPENCKNTAIPEINEVKDTLPEATWSNITMTKPDHSFHVKSVYFRIISTSPQIRAQIIAKGLHDTIYPLFPQNASADISMDPSTRLPFNFTINSLHTAIDDSQIDGSGIVHAAGDLPNSFAKIHLSITEIGKLIDHLSRVAPVKVTAAFLVARLMGDREPNHRTGWTVTLDNSKVRVNGKTLPINFQH
ncbi:hypothetical protein PT277_06260 [Acetobacteraceae bacterium ESL0709]|nr:hypothetical protein [Acetobacteraceae bacterium ESL0697]MDF7678301.1 hypothetical protein [Acetobacteraceae bacterium ESL0709]